MAHARYLLGLDVGSSSVKACLLDADTGKAVASATSPEREMVIRSPKPGWAEQDPETWWTHVVRATRMLFQDGSHRSGDVHAIGIAYQMHGLVLLGEQGRVLRPSIIWCDSRAVETGNRAFKELGSDYCLSRYLNSPGNFTASKLKWVKDHEPDVFNLAHKAMLPGDYIGYRMTGRFLTTESGLSEGVFWDFPSNGLATRLLDHYGIPENLLPPALPSFGDHGVLTAEAAENLGLKKGTKVTYRAGDQPNNALSLNASRPGDIATTAGTSGVVYAVTDYPAFDAKSRVNTFVHVNHAAGSPRYGILLCVNGTGILNHWLKRILGHRAPLSYEEMNALACNAPVGSEGVSILPFGNGTERILENRSHGVELTGLDLNRHHAGHLLRSAQEGIVYALAYGFDIMKTMGVRTETVKAGHANMFLSPIFRDTFVQTTGTRLELYNTDGAQGAARGSGLGSGVFASMEEAFTGLERIAAYEPDPSSAAEHLDSYGRWTDRLKQSYPGT